MKWAQNVILERKNGYKLIKGKIIKRIAKDDEYIADAIARAVIDSELLSLVLKKEHMDKTVAGLRIAQFVVDYGGYISNDVGHMRIE